MEDDALARLSSAASTGMRRPRALLSSTALPLLSLVMLGFGTFCGCAAQPPPRHVYELRLYHANEGKLDALIARFGDHTDAIFRRHHMTSVGYWVPEDGPSSHNLFVYILEHSSRQDAERNWATFQADPEWQKVKAESEVSGPLVDHIERYFMEPTAFSTLK
jgi:NIPSNAP